jgi:hypothetical protein
LAGLEYYPWFLYTAEPVCCWCCTWLWSTCDQQYKQRTFGSIYYCVDTLLGSIRLTRQVKRPCPQVGRSKRRPVQIGLLYAAKLTESFVAANYVNIFETVAHAPIHRATGIECWSPFTLTVYIAATQSSKIHQTKVRVQWFFWPKDRKIF